jgi:hypothetical protein
VKKYVLLYLGVEPSAGGMDDWNTWFAGLGDKVVDMGNPFGSGTEVVGDNVSTLGMSNTDVSGYSIVSAADLDEATAIAKACPSTGGVRVYEAVSM